MMQSRRSTKERVSTGGHFEVPDLRFLALPGQHPHHRRSSPGIRRPLRSHWDQKPRSLLSAEGEIPQSSPFHRKAAVLRCCLLALHQIVAKSPAACRRLNPDCAAAAVTNQLDAQEGPLTSLGKTTGLVRRSSGTSSVVSTTKNASPVSPTFMLNGATCGAGRLLGSRNVTVFSPARRTCSFPNLTWKGVDASCSSPSSSTWRTTMISIAPDRVAGLMPESVFRSAGFQCQSGCYSQ